MYIKYQCINNAPADHSNGSLTDLANPNPNPNSDTYRLLTRTLTSADHCNGSLRDLERQTYVVSM